MKTDTTGYSVWTELQGYREYGMDNLPTPWNDEEDDKKKEKKKEEAVSLVMQCCHTSGVRTSITLFL
jgi:hypothetical protein